jgi:hypothetical protein
MTQPATTNPNADKRVAGCVDHVITITPVVTFQAVGGLAADAFLVQCSCVGWTVPAVFATRENAERHGAEHVAYQTRELQAAVRDALGFPREPWPVVESLLISPWHVGWRIALGNLELLAIAGIARILRHRA